MKLSTLTVYDVCVTLASATLLSSSFSS